MSLNTEITKIANKEGNFILSTHQGIQENFDIVLLATPSAITKIEFEQIKLDPKFSNLKNIYYKLHNYYIKGVLNVKYFGNGYRDRISTNIIFTAEIKNKLGFGFLENKGYYDQNDKSQGCLYYTESRHEISTDQLKKMFKKFEIIFCKIWDFGYP